MEALEFVMDIFFNLRENLDQWTIMLGPWLYVLLFLVIFAETGLVVTPFLPGDSLLFALGALAATGPLEIWLLFCPADARGDPWGRRQLRDRAPSGAEGLSPRGLAFPEQGAPGPHPALLREVWRQDHRPGPLRPHRSDLRALRGGYWPDALPALRPLQYHGGRRLGGICLFSGYWFGNLPWVNQHFELVVVGIVLVSVMPMVVEYLLAQRRARQALSS
jgi:membrane-associated protein